VLVDGFYEWRGEKKHRQPFHFRRRDGKPFGLAAIYEARDGGALECAILTLAARPPVAEIHDRMPIPLRAQDHAAWLSPSPLSADRGRALLVPDPDADLVYSAVGTFVNDARHEGPECLAPPAQNGLFDRAK
jgi:putative SOS response-associated peptidase YedK